MTFVVIGALRIKANSWHWIRLPIAHFEHLMLRGAKKVSKEGHSAF